MRLAEVTVNFFFSVEDLSTLLTHILASSGLWSTSTFGYLTQLHLTPQYQEKRKKLHKLMCAAIITTHLFFFVLFAFFDGSRILGPPFAPPRFPASWTVIFPLPISMSSSLLLRLLDKHVASIFGACLRTQSPSTDGNLMKICGC